MAIQTINLGSYANDGSGDDLRTAFRKVNENFSLLGTDIPISEATNLGTNTIVVNRFLSKVQAGSFYDVTFIISTQSVIPPANQYYYLANNTNSLYNGHWMCTATTTTSVTLRYTYDPGVYGTTDGTTVSLAIGLFKIKNSNIAEFKSLISSDDSVQIVPGANTIDIKSGRGVINDPAPVLGGNLDIRGKRIIDTLGTGDVQTTIYGLNVKILDAMFGLMLQTNSFTIDMGVIQGNYTIIELDMGGIDGSLLPIINNNLDFGQI